MNKVFKPSLAALGLSAVIAAGSASAALTLDEFGIIFLEDDDIDFILNSDLEPIGGQVAEVGDVLFSVLEFNDANGDPIFPDELAGLAVGQVKSITPTGVGDFANVVLGAYTGGFNAVSNEFGGPSVPDGNAGEGALLALWLDPTPDLDISADNVSSGTVSCATLEECVGQATDGDLWEVDGFTGADGLPAGNEFWVSLNLLLDTSVILATNPAIELGQFNAGAEVLFDGSGLGLGEGPGIPCFPFCAVGEVVDMLIGGSIKGGDGLSAGLIADGAVATSDFDLTKTGVPEPSTLALLAAGFIGMGVAQRRRRRKA